MKPYDAFDAIDPFVSVTGAFDRLKGTLAGAEAAVLSHHELEDLIEVQGRELLRLLFQAHLDLREQRERKQKVPEGAAVVRGADGKVRPHCEPGHCRALACVFGTVTVGRTAWRGKGMTSVHPADAAYDRLKAAIDRRCGTVMGKRQAEQLVVRAAVDIDSHYRQ